MLPKLRDIVSHKIKDCKAIQIGMYHCSAISTLNKNNLAFREELFILDNLGDKPNT
jgi:hypothetical protein